MICVSASTFADGIAISLSMKEFPSDAITCRSGFILYLVTNTHINSKIRPPAFWDGMEIDHTNAHQKADDLTFYAYVKDKKDGMKVDVFVIPL